MAFQSRDGSKWTNAHQARIADKRHEAMQPQEPVDESQDEESSDPSEVVAQHGPAKAVSITHDESKHTVKSHHSDGHKHHSEHESAEEAHDTAKTLSGVGDESAPSDDMSDMNPSSVMMGQ